MLRQFGLPESAAKSLTRPELFSLEQAAYQTKHCATCTGDDTFCKHYKYVNIYVKDDMLIFDDTTCATYDNFVKNQKFARLINIANVPKRYRHLTAKDYDTQRGNEEAIDAAEDAILRDANVYFYGEVGTGKTMLAAIIANERARRFKRSTFVRAPNLLDVIKNAFRNTDENNTAAANIQRIANCDCLIMDDIGAEKTTDWTEETFFKIYNNRYEEMLQNITTSNLSPDELARHNGKRIARRILHNAAVIEI